MGTRISIKCLGSKSANRPASERSGKPKGSTDAVAATYTRSPDKTCIPRTRHAWKKESPAFMQSMAAHFACILGDMTLNSDEDVVCKLNSPKTSSTQ